MALGMEEDWRIFLDSCSQCIFLKGQKAVDEGE